MRIPAQHLVRQRQRKSKGPRRASGVLGVSALATGRGKLYFEAGYPAHRHFSEKTL
jgi:hypothetical protein